MFALILLVAIVTVTAQNQLSCTESDLKTVCAPICVRQLKLSLFLVRKVHQRLQKRGHSLRSAEVQRVLREAHVSFFGPLKNSSRPQRKLN